MGKEYTTLKRNAVYEYLKINYENAVSVLDIMDYLIEQDISMNITSVYRYLDKLYDQRKILKFVADKGNMTLYQYSGTESECNNHLHMQCVKCGKVTHLDCEFMNNMYTHLEKEHGYRLMCSNSVLYGVCNNCEK